MDDDSRQFHFDPETYLAMMISEVPAYEELEDRTAEATIGVAADRILDLGIGTGETAIRVASKHPTAHLVGIDESPEMLAQAATTTTRRGFPCWALGRALAVWTL